MAFDFTTSTHGVCIGLQELQFDAHPSSGWFLSSPSTSQFWLVDRGSYIGLDGLVHNPDSLSKQASVRSLFVSNYHPSFVFIKTHKTFVTKSRHPKSNPLSYPTFVGCYKNHSKHKLSMGF